jgi:putative addiction module killer protein
MQVRSTKVYNAWFKDLRDIKARAKIADRVARLEEGNPGDSRSVGRGVVELRINFGPGYRVYYIQRGQTILLLLCGGDKSTQSKDIERAKTLVAQQYPGEE